MINKINFTDKELEFISLWATVSIDKKNIAEQKLKSIGEYNDLVKKQLDSTRKIAKSILKKVSK